MAVQFKLDASEYTESYTIRTYNDYFALISFYEQSSTEILNNSIEDLNTSLYPITLFYKLKALFHVLSFVSIIKYIPLKVLDVWRTFQFRSNLWELKLQQLKGYSLHFEHRQIEQQIGLKGTKYICKIIRHSWSVFILHFLHVMRQKMLYEIKPEDKD